MKSPAAHPASIIHHDHFLVGDFASPRATETARCLDFKQRHASCACA
jgi:hypothetical protein